MGEKTLKILENEKFDSVSSICYMKATNDLACIWAEREQSAKSVDILLTAKKIYSEIKEKNNQLAPWDQWEILKDSDSRLTDADRWQNFESVHTHTLFYLAQTTKTLGQDDQSARYCGQCLERQLNSGEFEGRQWSLDAACLSQYYLSSDDYYNARHCLRASSLMHEQVK